MPLSSILQTFTQLFNQVDETRKKIKVSIYDKRIQTQNGYKHTHTHIYADPPSYMVQKTFGLWYVYFFLLFFHVNLEPRDERMDMLWRDG